MLTCADGARAFVEAVGTPLNPDTAQLLRSEARIAAALPAGLPVPRLRAHLEEADGDDEWVALLFDVVDGVNRPLPWTAGTAARVLAGVGAFTAATTPCPVPGLPSPAERLTSELTAWPLLRETPPADLDPWEADRLEELAGLPARWRPGTPSMGTASCTCGRTTCCSRPTAGSSCWTGRRTSPSPPLASSRRHPGRGRHGGLDPAALLARVPAVAAADPTDVTDLLLVLTGMWAVTHAQTGPTGHPDAAGVPASVPRHRTGLGAAAAGMMTCRPRVESRAGGLVSSCPGPPCASWCRGRETQHLY